MVNLFASSAKDRDAAIHTLASHIALEKNTCPIIIADFNFAHLDDIRYFVQQECEVVSDDGVAMTVAHELGHIT